MKIIKNVRLGGELTDITIENGKITGIGKTDAPGTDFGGNKIYPGLIDIHSHGCIGYDSSVGGIPEMADWQLEHGITTWYPTTMTVSEEDIIKATHTDIDLGHGANIPGFHLEGPFINVALKGAQNEKYVISPTMDLINKCKNVKMVTVAPEVEGAIEFIKECPAVIAIGHTTCDYDTAMAAFAAGARSLTHTFNCMPGIHHRNPGPIPAGAESGAYAQLITDGVHIHPSVVKMLYKLYGPDHITIISDSMQATAVGDGEYVFGGLDVVVKDGAARLKDSGNLAGSTTCLFDCVRQAIRMGIPEEDAVKMASETPATLMGLNKGRIEVGLDADFIIVDDDFNLVKAIARGEF
ncbi:MAG: N-acetylglucosamine-6-phosphate deacetylase [Clostridia bacterium]|nr:N-acetylglucosamine-6-phosphate deacetylase [Clostridia bacterium]